MVENTVPSISLTDWNNEAGNMMQHCRQIFQTLKKNDRDSSALNIPYNILHRVLFLSQTEMEQHNTINYSQHCVDLTTARSLVITPQGKHCPLWHHGGMISRACVFTCIFRDRAQGEKVYKSCSFPEVWLHYFGRLCVYVYVFVHIHMVYIYHNRIHKYTHYKTVSRSQPPTVNASVSTHTLPLVRQFIPLHSQRGSAWDSESQPARCRQDVRWW